MGLDFTEIFQIISKVVCFPHVKSPKKLIMLCDTKVVNASMK